MFNYSKVEITNLSQKFGFQREILEKVLRLVEILKYIQNSSEFSAYLALKGGTAINFTLFDLPRLSVDIDFDFSYESSKEEMMNIRNKLNAFLIQYMESEQYVLSADSKKRHALDSFVFSFSNKFGNKDHLKIEINYMNRVHIFNIETRDSLISFLPNFKVNTLNKYELYGSKINALISRCTIRDVYDVYSLIRTKMFNESELQYVKKWALFYLIASKNNEESIEDIFYNFKNKIEVFKSDRVPQYLSSTLRKSDKFLMKDASSLVSDFVFNLFRFNSLEKEFINEYKKGNYKPELLFDDFDIVNNIKNHPMILWKLKNNSLGSS